jgi:hypothetical protein
MRFKKSNYFLMVPITKKIDTKMININNTLYFEDGSKIFIKDLDFFKTCFHACFIKTFIYICSLILKKKYEI